MVDPTAITNYNLTVEQLEEHLLFWLFAAGHNAKSTAKGVDKFLSWMYDASGCLYEPFLSILTVNAEEGWAPVEEALSKSGLGCWRIKSQSVHQLVFSNLNLKTCSVEQLEEIKGIGPKTARCFILHSRKDARVAGLDTHVRKYLTARGVNVPKNPPTGKKYRELEAKFLEFCDEVGKSPAVFDLEIWNHYSGNKILPELA